MSCKFATYFQNTFFQEQLVVAASVLVNRARSIPELFSVFVMFDFIRELRLLDLVEQRSNQKKKYEITAYLYFYLRKSGQRCKVESYFCIVSFITCIINTINMMLQNRPISCLPKQFSLTYWLCDCIFIYTYITWKVEMCNLI